MNESPHPFEPSNTKMPPNGMSSERFSIAVTRPLRRNGNLDSKVFDTAFSEIAVPVDSETPPSGACASAPRGPILLIGIDSYSTVSISTVIAE